MTKTEKVGFITLIGVLLPMIIYVWLAAAYNMGWANPDEGIAILLLAIGLTSVVIGIILIAFIELNKD